MPKNPPRARGVGVHDTQGGWKEAAGLLLAGPAWDLLRAMGAQVPGFIPTANPSPAANPAECKAPAQLGTSQALLLCSALGEDKSEGSLPPLGKHQHRHLL